MDVQQFVKRNASTILSCVGIAGVVTTAVLAAKESPKVLTLLETEKEKKGEDLTKWEKVKIAAPVYAPAILVGTATIACVFGSNIINKKQQGNLIGAYALLDSSYKEFKKKTNELYGEDAGKHIRSEISKDKYAGDVTLSDDSKELFFDFYSGRYFESTRENVLWAQYETNRALYVNGCVGLNDYYRALGLEPKPEYEEFGWTCGQIEEMYWHPWIEFDYEETHIDEETEYSEGIDYTIIDLPMEPVIGYLDY